MSSGLYETYDFDMALYAYADHLVADYRKMGSDGNYSVNFERGKKYLKVVCQNWASRSAHAFISLADGDGWRYGDILKADGWSRPAKNFARGNVLNPNSYKAHRWNGI